LLVGFACERERVDICVAEPEKNHRSKAVSTSNWITEMTPPKAATSTPNKARTRVETTAPNLRRILEHHHWSEGLLGTTFCRGRMMPNQ